MRLQKGNAPSRWRGVGARNAKGEQRDQSTGFRAAGYVPMFYVAEVDGNRHLVERLTSIVPNIFAARRLRTLLLEAYPGAVIVRESVFVEIVE